MSAARWLNVAQAGEEFAAGRGHIGLHLYLGVPVSLRAMRVNANDQLEPNPEHKGGTPADAQKWLQKQWAKVRAGFAYRDIPVYGLRLAVPFRDCTPAWHVLLWVGKAEAQAGVRALIRYHWLREEYKPEHERARLQIDRLHPEVVSAVVDTCLCDSSMHSAWAQTWNIRRAVPFGGLHELAAWGNAPCA